jgi:CrcB protein
MPITLAGLLYVAAGAAIGGGLRYAVNAAFARAAFPFATLIVNVLGSFAIGAFAAYALRQDIGAASPLWLLVVTGLLGNFTTVSAFSLATADLAQSGRRSAALLNIAASIVLCLIAVALGYAAAA